MKIKFLKDYRYPGGGYSNKGDVRTFEDAEFAKWAIDNGFAEEVKESGWWKPKGGENYYFVDDSGYIKSVEWRDEPWEVDRYKIGNVFKTKAAAERYRGFRIAEATVRQDEGVLTPEEVIDASNRRDIVGQLTIGDNARDLEACICVFIVKYPVVGAIYFDTKEHAKSSLDNHPDEWKTIANYDWSRG